ncbi:hypothetical protein J8273_3758 [Carpediemonas membranifera]|uniref:Uncharacterized protein n=1 Tax=Carpediemonas membranifera TaxID=201153 RepID=A0A8J6E2V2_9EUKA|nr:hypothetical protein J8273_3758 [Carpediemonas membranifera]|eukprot:KAG9394781.1 hypothetical protein J8273_3758 [Carpediemonas membranifera]
MSLTEQMKRLLSEEGLIPPHSGAILSYEPSSPATPTFLSARRKQAPSPKTSVVARSLLPQFEDIENATVAKGLPTPKWSGALGRRQPAPKGTPMPHRAQRGHPKKSSESSNPAPDQRASQPHRARDEPRPDPTDSTDARSVRELQRDLADITQQRDQFRDLYYDAVQRLYVYQSAMPDIQRYVRDVSSMQQDLRGAVESLEIGYDRAVRDIMGTLGEQGALSPVSKGEVEKLLRWQAKQLFKAITIQLRREMTREFAMPSG